MVKDVIKIQQDSFSEEPYQFALDFHSPYIYPQTSLSSPQHLKNVVDFTKHKNNKNKNKHKKLLKDALEYSKEIHW